MDRLQGQIEAIPSRFMEAALDALLAKKAAKHGISLPPKKRARLAKRLLGKEKRLNETRWSRSERELLGHIGADDFDKLKSTAHSFSQTLPQLFANVIETGSTQLLAESRKQWPQHSKLRSRDVRAFNKRLAKLWGGPMELLRMLHAMAFDLGANVNDELSRSPTARNTPHTYDVLRRSHARACQIGGEVLTLLEHGYADGAMARWRTLHEIDVVAALISRHGEDLAERYVNHTVVEAKRASDDYQRCAPRLGYQPLTQHEIDRTQKAYDEVIQKYGPSFRTQYGWAAHQLQNQQPTFAALEQAAGAEYMRAYYRLASHNVHSNPKGIFNQLGLARGTPLLMAGPSNAGLTDPAQGTAVALVHITASFAGLQTSLENAIALRAMSRLSEEIPTAFADVEDKVKERTQRNADLRAREVISRRGR